MIRIAVDGNDCACSITGLPSEVFEEACFVVSAIYGSLKGNCGGDMLAAIFKAACEAGEPFRENITRRVDLTGMDAEEMEAAVAAAKKEDAHD